MKTENAFQLLVVLAISFSLFSCDDDSTSDDKNIKTGTLTHGGFDFSTGTAGSMEGEGASIEGITFDGEVINWRPGGGDYGNFYWRNDQGDMNNMQKDMGMMSIEDVTAIPSELNDIQPLVAGHVYAVKCQDGYAAFEVLSLDTLNWEADVKYLFTETMNLGTTFSEKN